MNAAAPESALPPAYWVEPASLLAGEYPGHPDLDVADARIAALLDAGVDYFLDLTWPDELPTYAQLLPSPYAPGPRRAVVYSRRPIRDHALPGEPLQMVEILDELDDALRGGHCVYVHCRAGIGRTGTVVGCWLARRLGSGTAALAALDALWRNGGRSRDYPYTPETDEQVEYVRSWRENRPPVVPSATGNPAVPSGGMPDWPAAVLGTSVPALPGTELPDAARALPPFAPPPPVPLRVTSPRSARVHGLVFGLAVGDALGMPYEGRRPADVPPQIDLAPGGPYELPAGAWTDDTALALLLAESLLERGSNDGRDQVARYARWQRDGQGSSTGRPVGARPTTVKALAQAQWTGNPYAGPHDPAKAEKDPLTRAAIAAAWAAADPECAVALAADVARPTHQAPQTLDACRYYAALLVGALLGASREALIAPNYSPVPGLWERRPLRPEVAAVAAGAWRRTSPTGGGRAVDALGLVLWSLERAGTWREAVLGAVALGEDAPTSGALVGALAGALFGVTAIPPHWRTGVAQADRLASTAERLAAAAEAGPSAV
jgi:ADP-ribosylglycohydrolase